MTAVPGGKMGLHCGLGTGLRGPRQRAGRHSRDRAVRSAAVPDRASWSACNEVHYAMVVIFAMGLGLFAPPFGVGFYAACAIGRVSPDVAMARVWPHLAALFVALLILIVVPWFSIGFL